MEEITFNIIDYFSNINPYLYFLICSFVSGISPIIAFILFCVGVCIWAFIEEEGFYKVLRRVESRFCKKCIESRRLYYWQLEEHGVEPHKNHERGDTHWYDVEELKTGCLIKDFGPVITIFTALLMLTPWLLVVAPAIPITLITLAVLLFAARLARRLNKLLNKHVADKEAHK